MKNFLLLLAIFFTSLAYGQFQPSQQQYLDRGNLLTNPGHENGKFRGWVYGGTGSCALSTTAIAGDQSILCTMTAQTIQMYQDVTSYMSLLANSTGVIRFSAINTAANATVCVRYNGVIQTGDNRCVTLTTDGVKENYEIPIIFNGTSTGLEFSATSTTGTTRLDNFELSDDLSTPEVSPAQLLGTVSFGSDCAWTSTQTGSFANIAADASCTITTTGRVSAPSTGIPAFKINAMPVGDYVVIQESGTLLIQGNTGDQTTLMRLSNGTDSTRTIQWGHQDTAATTALSYNGNLTYTLSNSSASDQTWQIQQFLTNAGSALWSLSGETKFSIYYYPPASKTYSQRCTNAVDCENDFSALVTDGASTTTVSNENLNFINGNCTNPVTGSYVCPFNSVYTVAPNCQVTPTGTVISSVSTTSSAASISFISRSDSVTAADSSFFLSCQKQGVDFKEKTLINGTFREVVTEKGTTKPIRFSYKVSSAGVISGQRGDTSKIPASCSVSNTSTFSCNYASTLPSVPNCTVQIFRSGSDTPGAVTIRGESTTQFQYRTFAPAALSASAEAVTVKCDSED